MSNVASALNLLTSKNNSSKVSGKQEIDGDVSISSSPQSFLATLVQAIDETNKFLPQNLKITQKEIVSEAMYKLQKGMFDESDKVSIFENLSFMQILGVLDKLKIESKDVKLANLSNELQNLLSVEKNFNSLKGAKNLSELLDVAKTLGLNVSNIKIDRLLDLKTTFPNLDKSGFFNQSVESVFKDFLNTKIAGILKNLNQSASDKDVENKQEKSSMLLKALQNLTNSNETKNVKNTETIKNEKILGSVTHNKTTKSSTQHILKDSESLSEGKKNQNNKVNSEHKFVKYEEIKTNLQNATKEADTSFDKKDNYKIDQKNMIKLSVDENKTESKVQDKDLNKSSYTKTPNLKENKNIQDKNSGVKTNEIKNDEIKNEEKGENNHKIEPKIQERKVQNVLKEQTVESKNFEIETKEKKTQEFIHTNSQFKELKSEEPKKASSGSNASNLEASKNLSEKTKPEIPKESKSQKNSNIEKSTSENVSTREFENESKFKENIVKESVVSQKLNNTLNSLDSLIYKIQNKQNTETNIRNMRDYENVSKEIKTENVNSKENTDLNTLVKDLSRVSQNEIKAHTNVKETFSHFSQDLKEAIQQYKAPITRLSITLNPSNLGEVEVTLVQRGQNLHINFSSNTNAMNLFVQNQAEFKNSLVNMGFTGLEMNFSDQNKKDNQQQNKNRSGYGFSEEMANEENNPLEMILVRYF